MENDANYQTKYFLNSYQSLIFIPKCCICLFTSIFITKTKVVFNAFSSEYWMCITKIMYKKCHYTAGVKSAVQNFIYLLVK